MPHVSPRKLTERRYYLVYLLELLDNRFCKHTSAIRFIPIPPCPHTQYRVLHLARLVIFPDIQPRT